MLVLDNINSISDVITNSSSELFVINDKDTTLNLFKKVISPILDGYYEPFIFDLNTFREWVENSNEDNSTDMDKCFQIIFDWFIDLHYLDGLTHYISNNLYRIYLEDYIKMEDNLLKELYTELIKEYNNTFLPSEEIDAFLQKYDKDKIDKIINYLLNTDFKYDIRKLDGKIILLSKEENSISCSNRSIDPIEWLNNTFNVKQYHLG